MLRSTDLEWVPRPVVALADEYPARFVDPRHAHARALYRHAVESRYRFFSYGDAMLIDHAGG